MDPLRPVITQQDARIDYLPRPSSWPLEMALYRSGLCARPGHPALAPRRAISDLVRPWGAWSPFPLLDALPHYPMLALWVCAGHRGGVLRFTEVIKIYSS